MIPGTKLPGQVRRRIKLRRAGSIDELVTSGMLPSSETLAELLPQLTAVEMASLYADPALGA